MVERELLRYYSSCKEYFWDLQSREFKEWYLKYYNALRPIDKGLCLDVGCGVGQVVNKLGDDEYPVIGVDVSLHAIRIAHKSRSKNADFIVASVYNLPFRNNSFGSSGCRDVLEHLHHPEFCLAEMVRVLKRKGRIVLSSPNFLNVVRVHALTSSYRVSVRRTGLNMLNLVKILKKMFNSALFDKAHFDFILPDLDWQGERVGHDLDAICATNPIDIKFHLKQLSVKIVHHSATQTPYTSKVVEKLACIPILRDMLGGIFIIGVKETRACI